MEPLIYRCRLHYEFMPCKACARLEELDRESKKHPKDSVEQADKQGRSET